MSIILEQIGHNVCIYADEPISISLYEYINNELQQPSIYSEKVISTHSQTGTEVHTAMIEVINTNIDTILHSLVDRFHGNVRNIEGKYYIEISHLQI
ncbi:hypothetical protein [Paenibacillus alginolyticus]|uniref:Uncharacterized protein n=1 Tax=Paenibacillus alginolyticus TaxID=59839 RepID=A0ABT4GJP5_9BACL|nr:hypothetical protein [Paenibacillus alginolyticus]MCY9696425.1 hypothetical protein [Paenibacillus alginolyticus]MEC0145260.1 hypothetical protein [Paenibacillus alginolyticus]